MQTHEITGRTQIANHPVSTGRLDGMEAHLDSKPESSVNDQAVPARRGAFSATGNLLAVIPIALLGFVAVTAFHSPQSGPLAIGLVLEPHLFLAVLVILTPVALLGRANVLAATLLLTLTTGGILFGSEWMSLPGSGASHHDLSV